MTYTHKKWLPMLCLLSLPAYSSNDVDSYVDNNVLNIAAVKSRVVQQSFFLEIDNYQQQQVMVGEYGRIMVRNADDGNWLQAEVPVQTTITAVEFINTKTAWAVGHQGVILTSNDGGLVWRKAFDGSQLSALIKQGLQAHARRLEALLAGEQDPDQLDELEMQREDVEYKLEDLTADTGLEIAFFDVLFTDSKHGIVIGAYGAMLETYDGGDSWQYVGLQVPNPDGLHLNAITQDSHNNIYIVGEAGFAMASLDRGKQWQALNIDYTGSLFGITANDNALYSYGLRGNMFASADRGQTWKTLDTGVANHIFAADWLNNEQLLLVGAGGLKLVFDGIQFTNISQPSERIDITSVKVSDVNIVTTNLRGWKAETYSKLLQGGSK